MKRGLVAYVFVLVIWLIYFALVGLVNNTSEGYKSFLWGFTLLFSILSPLGIVAFFERQSTIKRFGLQPSRFLSLGFFISMTLATCYLSNILSGSPLSSIVIAPLSEEWLFRGYMTGKFRDEDFLRAHDIKFQRTIKVFVGPILLVSVAFAVSHLFVYGLTDLPQGVIAGVVFGFVFLVSGSVLFSMTAHAVWNYLLLVKPAYRFSTPWWFWLFLLLLPAILQSLKQTWEWRKSKQRADAVIVLV